MRVAHICQSADPNVGGSLTVARALVNAQRNQGIDARLVFLYRSDYSSAVASHREHEIFCQVDRRSRWLRGISILRRKLEKINPDIIHHHDGILWPRLATAGLGRPLMTHAHLGRPQVSRYSGAYWIHRYIAAHTDCLLAISAWVRESWVKGGFPRERTRLIPNGVDCAHFYPRTIEVRRSARIRLGLPVDQKLLLWVGRLDRETKGLDRLVATARALPAGIQLIIAGNGPARNWLGAELEASNLVCPPLVLGKLDDPAELFGVADAFLLTSKVEPFGLVLLEAAASGLPIFAFECVGGAMNLLHELGALVVTDVAMYDFFPALAAIHSNVDPALIERICQEYSWAAVARATSAVYTEFSTRQKTE